MLWCISAAVRTSVVTSIVLTGTLKPLVFTKNLFTVPTAEGPYPGIEGVVKLHRGGLIATKLLTRFDDRTQVGWHLGSLPAESQAAEEARGVSLRLVRETPVI
jgi:hypothetical protein